MSHAFSIVGQQDVPTAAGEAEAASQQQTQATRILLMALATISKRAVAAIADLKGVLTVASAWWLWMHAPANPSPTQLIGLGMYGLMVLAANVIWRRPA